MVEYTVSLTRVTGSGQTLCPSVEDNRPAVTAIRSSISFADLEEFSTYKITVTSVYDVFNETSTKSSTVDFTTSSASKDETLTTYMHSFIPTLLPQLQLVFLEICLPQVPLQASG